MTQPKDQHKKLPETVEIKFVNSKKSVGADQFAGIELSAELFFSHIFGDKKYYQTASRFNQPAYCKKQIKKLISHLKDDIDSLIASEVFIANATKNLEQLETILLTDTVTKERLAFAISALRPIATFLGYGIGSKHKSVEPYFIPSVWQEMLGWSSSEEYFKNSDTLRVKYRAQIAHQLKRQGLTYAEIAEVLNQSGYRIAQLIKLPDNSEEQK